MSLLKRSRNRFATGQQRCFSLTSTTSWSASATTRTKTTTIASSSRYFSGLHRPSPLRQKKLSRQRELSKPTNQANNSNNSSSEFQDAAKKNAKSKLMLVGANAVLFFGMSIWLLLFVDKYFQNSERECIQSAQEQLYADFGDLDLVTEQYSDTPVQFTCMVRLRSRELRELFPVEIGDLVDVLAEGVGRDGNLNICRTRPRNTDETPVVGIYPMGCLQRVNLEQQNQDNDTSESA